MEPVGQSQPHTTMTLGRDGKNPLKTLNFDAAYPRESSQVWFFIMITAEHGFKYFYFCLLIIDLS